MGSAPVTPQLFEFMKDVWCQTRGGPAAVGHGYGSTECGTIVRTPATPLHVQLAFQGLLFGSDRLLVLSGRKWEGVQHGEGASCGEVGAKFFVRSGETEG